MKKVLLLTVALGALVASPAMAAEYDFTYTGTPGSGISGSGTITTDSDAATQLITGISGTFNGEAITALLPPGTFFISIGPFGLPGNDNLLTFPATNTYNGYPTYLDRSGFAFSTATELVNVYFGLGGYGTIMQDGAGNVTSDVGSNLSDQAVFSVSPIAAAVPEPSTWGMMIVGFGAVGFAMRRRQRITSRVSYSA